MNSIMESWMSPSTMGLAMDMIIAFMCGAGLFFLLLPFLKECPVSPPPKSEQDIRKYVKRRQKKTKKKTTPVKDCRDGGKTVEETKTPLQPMKNVTKQLVQDSTRQTFWNPLQKMDHLPLSRSYLKVLEDLIQQNFSRHFWGTVSIFSESVVATAHRLRNPSLIKHKSVRFVDACVPDQAPSKAKGPPQHSRYQPLPHQLVTPNLVGGKRVQEKKILPSSIPKQIPPCFKSRDYAVPCPTTKRKIQASLPIESLPQKHGLYSKDSKVYDGQKHQKPISKHTGNLPGSILPTKALRPASIHPEHYQMLQYLKTPQNKYKATNVGEQQGTCMRLFPFSKLTQHQGHFPANSDHYCKSRSELSQPAQPSIHNSKSCKCGKMMESVPTGVPLKMYSTNKGLGVEAKKVPCISSSPPGKGLKLRKSALRTDKMSNMNPAEHHSLPDSKTERKLAPNITELPMKCRRRSYLQSLEPRDLAPPGVPATKLPKVLYPPAHICGSKAEHYPKAARVLENLHLRDPGGTRAESASGAKVERTEFIHSPAKVQETQRDPLPAASRGASKTHPDPLKRYLSIHRSAFYFQVASPQQSRTIRGIGKGSLEPNTNPKMAKCAQQKSFQKVDSGHHHCSVTTVDPRVRVPPSAAKQNIVEVKEEPPHAWRVSLGSRKSHKGQDLNISSRVSESIGSNRSSAHIQTPTQQHSKSILSLHKQPEAWSVRHHSDGPSRTHSAKVSPPSQHTLPIFETRYQNPKTSHGLYDVSMRRHKRMDSQENRVPKYKIKVKNLKGVHPPEERRSTIRSRAISRGERLGRVRSSILSSTQLKDTTKTQIPEKGEATSQSSGDNITRNALQDGDLSTKYTGQGDSSKYDNPPPPAEQTQEVLTRNKIVNSMIVELQSLVNVLFQILENNIEDPSKVQGCKVESRTSQLGGSAHTSECLCDTNLSRPASRRSCGHASPEIHNYPFTYRGTGDKLQAGIEDQRACDHHLNQVKRGMCFDQLPMPKQKELPCGYRAIGDKQKPGLAEPRSRDSGGRKIVVVHCPHRSPEGHNQSFRNRDIGDEQQSGVDHKAFDPHQSTKKAMGSGCFLSPKENHPVMHRGCDCSWPPAAAQQASHLR